MAALTRGRYLAREEVLNVVTPGFIVFYGMSAEVSAGDVKLGESRQISLTWYHPFRTCSLRSPMSIIMT